MTYTCKTCGKTVSINNGTASCGHSSGVIAHLKATATGAGGVKS